MYLPMTAIWINIVVIVDLSNISTIIKENYEEFQQYEYGRSQEELFAVIEGLVKLIKKENEKQRVSQMEQEILQMEDVRKGCIGDIIVTAEQVEDLMKDQHISKRKVTTRKDYKWTSPIIYRFDSNYTRTQEDLIHNAAASWSANTCLDFKYNQSVTTEDHIKFQDGAACTSYVGRHSTYAKVGQVISMNSSCFLWFSPGIATHEIGHALGLYHEHQRLDRDCYIWINKSNVRSQLDWEMSFKKADDSTTHNLQYDYGSVMHYEPSLFAKTGATVISTKDLTFMTSIGQQVVPSFYDIKIINMEYCHGSCSPLLNCVNGGYTNPSNCSQCNCQDGWSGTLCDKVEQGSPKCSPESAELTIQFNASAQVIESPGYAQSIKPAGIYSCNWLITAEEGYHLKLWFDKRRFYLLSGKSACFAWVEIKDSNVAMGERFCGNTVPDKQIYSSTNKVLVIYKSSSYLNYPSDAWYPKFKLMYRSEKMETNLTNNYSNDIHIREKSEWGGKPAKTDLQPIVKVKYLFVHETGGSGCYTNEECVKRVQEIQISDMEKQGYPDIGYNFLIGENGEIYQGRGWQYTDGKTQFYNEHTISIAVIGEFYDSTPSKSIADAIIFLTKRAKEVICYEDNIPVYGYRDVLYGSTNPGDKLYEILWNITGYNTEHLQMYNSSYSSVTPAWLIWQGAEYQFVRTALNYSQARDDCIEKGSLMSSVVSVSEAAFITSQINDSFWIGLLNNNPNVCSSNCTGCPVALTSGRCQSCYVCRNKWTWSDGKPMAWLNWEDGQPKHGAGLGRCGKINADGKWYDEICDRQFQYICKKDAIASSPPTMDTFTILETAEPFKTTEAVNDTTRSTNVAGTFSTELTYIVIGVGTGVLVLVVMVFLCCWFYHKRRFSPSSHQSHEASFHDMVSLTQDNIAQRTEQMGEESVNTANVLHSNMDKSTGLGNYNSTFRDGEDAI